MKSAGRKNISRRKFRKRKGLGEIPGQNREPEKYFLRGNESSVQDFKTIVLYSILGLGTATGLFFLARHFYKKTRKNTVERKTLEEGNPATLAKQLKMAFDNDNWAGWGTDEEKVKEVFNQIPSKSMYAKVQRAYFDLYAKPLNSDLEDELSSEEYNEILRIINSKKQ